MINFTLYVQGEADIDPGYMADDEREDDYDEEDERQLVSSIVVTGRFTIALHEW